MTAEDDDTVSERRTVPTDDVGSGPIGLPPVRFGRLVRGTIRRWPVILLLGGSVAFALFSLFRVQQRSTLYEAQATVVIEHSAAEEALNRGFNPVILDRDLANFLELATSDDLRTAAEEAVGSPLGNSRAELVENTDAIRFVGSSSSPQTAALIADAWAEVFVEEAEASVVDSIDALLADNTARLEQLRASRTQLVAPFEALQAEFDITADPTVRQSLIREIDRQSRLIEADISVIDSELRTTAADRASFELGRVLADQGVATLTQRALAPPERSGPVSTSRLATALGFGALVGLGAAAALARLDHRLFSEDDVLATGLPVLATVPYVRRPSLADPAHAMSNDPDSALAHAYVSLRAAVMASHPDRLRSLALVAVGRGEGTTTTAANLATAFSIAGSTTILVDADLRQPQTHTLFKLNRYPGLVDAVLNPDEYPWEDVVGDTGRVNDPWVLSSGTPTSHPAEVLSSNQFAELGQDLGLSYDMVIYDTAALVDGADATGPIRSADAVLLIVRTGRSRVDVIRAARLVRRSGGMLIGVAFTDVEGAVLSKLKIRRR